MGIQKREPAAFAVDQVDHIELFVPDRHEAARWYQQVLGLEIVPEFANWADDPGGPLMISTRQAGTKLALFTGTPRGARPTAGFHRVAFRVGAPVFTRFVAEVTRQFELLDETGRRVTAQDVVDHGEAQSIYFCDPYGHRLEITCYEVSELPSRAAAERAE